MARVYRPSSVPDETVEKVIEPTGATPGRVYNTPAADEETGAPDPSTPVVEHDGTLGGFDPSAHTADEVNDHLAAADADERERVLAAEYEGQARKGILEGPHAPEQA